MSDMIYPARRWSFHVEGIAGPCQLSDDELQLVVFAQRQLLLGMLSAAMPLVPIRSQDAPTVVHIHSLPPGDPR